MSLQNSQRISFLFFIFRSQVSVQQVKFLDRLQQTESKLLFWFEVYGKI